MSDEFEIQYEFLDIEALHGLWCDLEPRSENNFFLSWPWMKTWIEIIKPEYKVLQIRYQGELVALGLLTIKPEKRHRFLYSNVLRLAQTGDADDDQIWIEYNGLLTDVRYSDAAIKASMQFLVGRDDWDEFCLGAIPLAKLSKYYHEKLTKVIYLKELTHGVDLSGVRDSQKDYLSCLSRNTRYQINRTRRIYEKKGELEFYVTNKPEEIEKLWPELAELHIARWGDGKGQSGFANQRFVDFHKALIDFCYKDGFTDFCVLTLDNDLIGCLYNFIYKGRVYFYLSGLKYSDDSQLKPGLLLHAMAIQYYVERGLNYYDFMGGDSRYKRSLAKEGTDLQIVSFQKAKLRFRLEQVARKILSCIEKP